LFLLKRKKYRYFILGLFGFLIIIYGAEVRKQINWLSLFHSRAPSEFSDFQYYGKPKLLQTNSLTLQISSDSDTKPGGLKLNFKLDRSKSYGLLIAGKYLEGKTLLVLNQDNHYLWVPTPNKLSDNLFVINNLCTRQNFN